MSHSDTIDDKSETFSQNLRPRVKQFSFHFFLGKKVEKKPKSKTMRVLRNTLLVACHKRCFSMFRFATLRKMASAEELPLSFGHSSGTKISRKEVPPY